VAAEGGVLAADPGDGVAEPGGDGLAGPLGVVAEAAGAAAEAGPAPAPAMAFHSPVLMPIMVSGTDPAPAKSWISRPMSSSTFAGSTSVCSTAIAIASSGEIDLPSPVAARVPVWRPPDRR
jgi:hypothetical protein